ncbi:hypothetical protein OS187_05655 [Xanthomonadaceae bacterium JHOS43]|nr:hypothetical protein [Xanthomonadaceae bacterium JHOS43]
MTHRLLLASFLLVLGFNAHAAMNRVHGTSGDTGPNCPPATLAEPGNAGEVPSELAVPTTIRPVAPPSGNNANPAMPRPGLRWHSFLPGMMK